MKCAYGNHLPDCRLVESTVTGPDGEPYRFHECTRCEGCGALPGEMGWCGWPEEAP